MRAGVRALVFILNYTSKKGVPAPGGTQNPLHLSLFAGNLAPRICGRCPQPAIFLTLAKRRCRLKVKKIPFRAQREFTCHHRLPAQKPRTQPRPARSIPAATMNRVYCRAARCLQAGGSIGRALAGRAHRVTGTVTPLWVGGAACFKQPPATLVSGAGGPARGRSLHTGPPRHSDAGSGSGSGEGATETDIATLYDGPLKVTNCAADEARSRAIGRARGLVEVAAAARQGRVCRVP